MPWLRTSLAFLVVGGLAAADWPQWLGPHRDASSSEVIAPWKDPPAVVWRVPVGEGHSAPVVAQGRVFLHTKIKDKEAEAVTALDAATGKLLWNSDYPRTHFTSLFGNGPRATPAVAEGRLFTMGVTGVLSCFDAATGKQVWQVDTWKEFHAPGLFFGAAGSPLVDGDRVLINVGAKEASIVAFDKANGRVLWKALDDRASYSSPILYEQAGRRQVVFFTQHGLVSLNPDNGNAYWSYPLIDLLSESSATPVRVGDLLIASSITNGSVALHLASKANLPTVREAWKDPALTCYFSTPVAVGDQLYVVSGTKPPALTIQSTLHCVDLKTGKELWRREKVGRYHASLLRTGDNKLLLLEDSGHLALLAPNPKEYRELARSKICGETWAHPALADGRLYVRDMKELLCLKVGK